MMTNDPAADRLHNRRCLSACVALGALAAVLGGTAASAAPATPADQGAAAADDAQLGDIVVTANRREENINKVSASIVALNQAALDQQGIRNFQDIVTQTPGLSLVLPSTFQPANIAIRGIRSVVGAATTGIYIDDTPVQVRNITAQDPGDALPYIFDLGRVEVLRGPQGTLFGSGSEGGAVRFISPTPDLDETSAYGRAEVATTDSGSMSYEAGVAAGTPIIEGKLGLRVSASYRHNGGFVDRIDQRTGATIDGNVNSANVHTMKVALQYAPTEELRITPSVNFQETRNHDVSQYFARLSDPSEQRLRSGAVMRQPSRDRFYLPTLKVESDFGGVTATSVSSYFARNQSGVQDFSIVDHGVVSLFNGFSPVPDPNLPLLPIPVPLPQAYIDAGGSRDIYANRQRNFTQEVRLQSNDSSSPLSWVIGGFYQNNKQINAQHVDNPYYAAAFEQLLGLPNVNGISNYALRFQARDKQVAGFANVDYRIGAIKLSAGGRIASTRFSFSQALSGPLNGPAHTNVGKQKETPFTPKFSASWEPGSNALLYVSAAKGFRVGGANTPVPASPPCQGGLAALGLSGTPATYDSDSVWNYEVGGKVGLFDRKLQVNASAYHIDWSNIQSFVALSGCPTGFVANLGSANSDGFDLSISARPFEALLVSVSGGYNRSRFEETIVRGGVVLAEKGGIVSDAPPWQVTTTVEYAMPLQTGSAYVRGIDQYASRNNGRYSKLENPLTSGFDPAGQRNEGFHSVSLRLGWRKESFDLSLFADNLFNAHPQLNYVSNAFPTDTTYYANTLRPRTVGLTLTARN
jgi:iron complex outermembrane receptor protein